MFFSKKAILLILVTIGSCSLTRAQDSSNTKSSYFKLSASYLTNALYNGRKDSVTLPYLTPSIGYFSKTGFYVNASLSYLAASGDSRIDLFTLETGYDFTISNQLSGGLYASKFFYNTSSTAVRSQTQGAFGGNLSYDPGMVTLSSGIDFSFASKMDINLFASIAREFYFGDNEEWSFTPAFSVNAGTQNSYQDYVKKRKSKRGNTPNILTNATNNFTILSYELSLPLAYDRNNWGLFFTPTYAIPQGPIAVSSSTGSGFVTEKLENSFYAQLGFYLKL